MEMQLIKIITHLFHNIMVKNAILFSLGLVQEILPLTSYRDWVVIGEGLPSSLLLQNWMGLQILVEMILYNQWNSRK